MHGRHLSARLTAAAVTGAVLVAPFITSLRPAGATMRPAAVAAPSATPAPTSTATRTSGTLYMAHGDPIELATQAHDHSGIAGRAAPAITAEPKMIVNEIVRPDGSRIQVDGALPESLAGQTVSVAGPVTNNTVTADRVYADPTAAPAPRLLSRPRAGTTTRRAAVILISFSDGARWATATRTAAQVRAEMTELMFGSTGSSVADHVRQSSDGVVDLTGTVFGEYVIPSSLASAGSCLFPVYYLQALLAASGAGVALDTYNDAVVIWPTQANCGFGGVGYLGVPGSGINYANVHVIAHELGHNWSLHHAASLSCTDSSGAQVTLSNTCTAAEYGDMHSAMGVSSHLHHGGHQAQIDRFLTGSVPAGFLADAPDGTYRLARRHQTSSDPQVLRVPRGSLDTRIDLEIRSSTGTFDNFGTNATEVLGVMARIQKTDLGRMERSYLLDGTPETLGVADAMLRPGSGFVDPATGTAIYVAAVDADGATVRVVPANRDTEAPSAVTALATSYVSKNSMILNWSPATDDTGVVKYVVSRNGTVLDSTRSTRFGMTGLTADTTYAVSVTAIDVFGKAGPATEISVTTTGPDRTPPSPVTNLRTTSVSQNSAYVAWSPSTDDVAVAGYVLNDGTRNALVSAASPMYALLNLQPATPYTVTVTAYDTSGNASPPAQITFTTTSTVTTTTSTTAPPTTTTTRPPTTSTTAPPTTTTTRPPTTNTGSGSYRIVSTAGSVANFGNAAAAGQITTPLNRPIVGMAATPTGNGYWLVSADGGIFTFGDARFLGSTGNLRLNQPIVGMAATPTGNGYWLVALDGGIFAFGDARFLGSTGNLRLNRPIVGMAATPTGNGYWLVSSDGGIFTFGDAKYLGSTGNLRLTQPITGMSRTPTGNGYWLVSSDGGIFTFGDAKFLGSAGNLRLTGPVLEMAATASGNGYWLVSTDGKVFTFGDAPNLGNTGAGFRGFAISITRA